MKRQRRETEEGLTYAWLNANWQRAKKMPDLDKVLAGLDKSEEPQKPETMLDIIKGLNAKFGGSTY